MCTKLYPTSHPSPSPQRPPSFAFSHPLVYAFRVQDRVQALDRFIHYELHPKVVRLREEHICIEHQFQRTMTKKHDSVGISTTKETTGKQKQSQRLKQQAWLWKRTSKRRELNRFESFFGMATELQTISKNLNPNILRLTVLWQRSESIAPNKHVAADDSNDVVYDEKGITGNGDRRRFWERHRLSREYQNACKENVRVSKSIQNRIDKLMASKIKTSSNTEDASILSSLIIFSNNYVACGTCKAKFHKDYFDALVARVPNKCERKSHASNNESTFLCIHCWNLKAREQRKERDRETHFSKTFCTKHLSPKSNDGNSQRKKDYKSQTTPTSKSQNEKTPLYESGRWKARKTVINQRMEAVAMASNGESSRAYDRSATGAITAHDLENAKDNESTASSAFDHYIESMSSLDNSLIRIGESLSSYSDLILGETDQDNFRCDLPPLLHPLPSSVKATRTKSVATMKLQMNNSAVVVDCNNVAKHVKDVSKQNDTWSRFGSSSSSICSNSIVESDPEGSLNSRIASASNKKLYTIIDQSRVGKIPLKVSDNWNRYESLDSSICNSSVFSKASIDTSMYSPSSSKHFRPKYIKSAIKNTSASLSPSAREASPTKVNDFPFGSSHKKKSVQFGSPLVECKVYDPMADTRSNKALLDTSAEIMNRIEYFCKWDTFMNAFEEKTS